MEALYETSYIKFMTKKHSQRGRKKSFSGGSNGLDGKFQHTGSLSNSIVPYEMPVKKHRAKVDLDPETTRVWNLLMGKATEPDVNNDRWWEQERKVFKGRVDSFIARMRLVQGDRRFSRWKGSVVDSVVGVFLTQNVSDHLSSSAYMSLAASFPLSAVGESMFDSYDSEVLNKAAQASTPKKTTTNRKNKKENDWDRLRRNAYEDGYREERTFERRDSVDWEAVRRADVHRIFDAIRERGFGNMLAGRIKDFLNRLVRDHGSIDLEWLRQTPPDSAKDYLLSIEGLGLKSVECVRLLTLEQRAFPVDTNVGRICVRLGWVPIQPLPESLQLHLLEQYPVLDTIQKYLWPRQCKLYGDTLYELHYHLITCGKVFCTKINPNCNACPLKSECRHFASAFASTRLALPAPEEKSLVYSGNAINFQNGGMPTPISTVLLQLEGNTHVRDFRANNLEPIIEEPESPREEERPETRENEMEDYGANTDGIPFIKLNNEALAKNVEIYFKERNKDLGADDIAKALVAIRPEEASIPVPKLKHISRLRTEHTVYELPDSHPLVKKEGLDQREPGDPSPYLLTIWMKDDIEKMSKESKTDSETDELLVRCTILVPCRTAMKGRFPLNGTYFQVNEVFADHKTSHDPIYVARKQIWKLRRRMAYFGTSVTSIFKGLTTVEVQKNFWGGFVCVRGFERGTRAPRPLCPHLHIAASKLPRSRKSAAATEQNADPASKLPRSSRKSAATEQNVADSASKLPRSRKSAATEQNADSARASVVNDLLPPDDVPDEPPEDGGKEVPEARPARKKKQPAWLAGHVLG